MTSGLEHYTSVSASRDGRRIVATVANPTASLWRVPLLDRTSRRSRRAAVRAVDARGRWRRASAGRRCFICPASGAGDGLWRFQDGKASEVWKGDERFVVGAARGVARRNVAWPSSSGRRGSGGLTIMSADGTNCTNVGAIHRHSRFGGPGSADWSPDGAWIVAGGQRRARPGLVQDPCRRRRARPSRHRSGGQSGLVAGRQT